MGEVGEKQRHTILLVDDNRTNRLVLRSYLVGEGYEFMDTSTGAEALALLRTTVPSLIISDVIMPDVDGFALVRAVRTDVRKNVREIPIILASAKSTEDVIKKCREVGANVFMKKPIDWQELANHVRELLPR